MRKDEHAFPLEPEVGFMPLDEQQEGPWLHPGLARLNREGNYDEVIGRRPDLLATLKQLDGLAVLGLSGFYTHVWSLQSSLQKKPEYELQVADLEFLQLLALKSCPGPTARVPTPGDFEPLWEDLRVPKSSYECFMPPSGFLRFWISQAWIG